MSLILDGTNGETFPSWTTATRPASPAVGQMGYNTSTGNFDAYTASGWVTILPSASGSTTQLAASSLPSGSVIQTVYATNGTNSSNSTTTLAATGLTATITPQFNTSRIMVLITQNLQLQTSGSVDSQASWTCTRNGTTVWGNQTFDQLRMTSNSASDFGTGWPAMFIDTPSSTSALTYATYYAAKSASGVTVINADSGQSAYMILMEIR